VRVRHGRHTGETGAGNPADAALQILCQTDSKPTKPRASGRPLFKRILHLHTDVMSTETLTALKTTLDPRSWSEDPDELAPHVRDWRNRYRGVTPLLLKPATTDEVSRILSLCNRDNVAITPQSGNTSLVGVSIPQGEVVLSLKRMNAIGKIDATNESLTCEAGVIVETVQNTAIEQGKLFPLSLGAQGSAMIGGLISTNAGGVHVLRYGMMRDLVLGLQVVLPDGRVLSDLKGLRKDNTGYDLKQLFIGAEGTLGVVTAATVKLFPRPASTAVALAAVDSPAKAVELLTHVKNKTGGGVAAFELMSRSGLNLAVAHLPDARHPIKIDQAWTVLIELVSAEPDRAQPIMEKTLGTAFEHGLIGDAALAQTQAQAKAFWTLRESIPEAERTHGKAVKHDISVPVSHISVFMEEATRTVESMLENAFIIAFGHVGDGNIHFNVTREEPGAGENFVAAAAAVTEAIYDLVDKHGGSISAEHGVGILKRRELARRKPVHVQVMRAIKSALDPNGVMNPRVLLGED